MLLGGNGTSSTLYGPYEYASCGRGQTDAVMSAYGLPERPEMPQEGPGGGGGGSTVASVTLFDHYMLTWSGFRPQMLGTIVNDGPGGIETIRGMRVERLHRDLGTTLFHKSRL